MKQPAQDQQKISVLIITVLILILFAMIGFSSAVVYSIAQLNSNIQNTYSQPISVNNAGLNAYINLSHLHSHMLQTVFGKSSNIDESLDKGLAELDEALRNDFVIIKSEYPEGDAEMIAEVEQLLDDWTRIRKQMISLIRHGHRDQALQLASSQGIQIYHQLEMNLEKIVTSSQLHVEALVKEAIVQSSKIIRMIWWFLAGLILTSIISGILVIRKITTILEHNRQTDSKLHESEERMKLALSGADVATWDLDVTTGKLDLDPQWGSILNYMSDQERPHQLIDWAALIHTEDRERVLKSMQDHIAGQIFEYKAEYRIHAQSGKLKWVIDHGKAVLRDKNGKALRVVGITRDITIQKHAEDTIWKLAHTDALTGLPNRSLFYDRLGQCIAQAKRQSKKIALLFLDLDDFKIVNDTFGHDTGDVLLQEVAERLRHAIRSENTVARTGGDEFIFILTDISNAENAAIVASKIIQSLDKPFLIHGNSCHIGSSIGISIFPDDSEEIEKLVTQADNAMYKAKEKGKNNYQFYSSHL